MKSPLKRMPSASSRPTAADNVRPLAIAGANIAASIGEAVKRLGHVPPMRSRIPPMEECVNCEKRKGTVLGNDGRLYCSGCAK